jgi:hypothetical protein
MSLLHRSCVVAGSPHDAPGTRAESPRGGTKDGLPFAAGPRLGRSFTTTRFAPLHFVFEGDTSRIVNYSVLAYGTPGNPEEFAKLVGASYPHRHGNLVELFRFFPIEVRAIDEERAMSGQPWTEDDNAKLKSLAGTKSSAEVAAELGRTEGAVIMQASKLKISMAYKKSRRATFTHPQSAPSL